MHNRDEKKNQILLAAFKIFGRDGFYKAKVSDIAKAANIGKGTIYEYFDSKKNVFEEMVKFGIEIYFKRVSVLIDEQEDVIEKLKKYIIAEKQMMIEFGNIANIFVQEADKIGKEVKCVVFEARKNKLAIVEKIIKEGVQKGIFREIDTYLTALAFIGGVHQMLVDELYFSNSNKKRFIPEEFLQIFISGIKKTD